MRNQKFVFIRRRIFRASPSLSPRLALGCASNSRAGSGRAGSSRFDILSRLNLPTSCRESGLAHPRSDFAARSPAAPPCASLTQWNRLASAHIITAEFCQEVFGPLSNYDAAILKHPPPLQQESYEIKRLPFSKNFSGLSCAYRC